MIGDYRQRIYQSYMRSSGHYYQRMTDISVYEALYFFFRKNHLPWLPQECGAHILDVGCGAGHCLYFLQKEGYINSEGIDVSPEMIAQCQTRGLANVYLADWADFLPSRPETYGAIIANDFLEHLTKEEVLHFLDLCLFALQPHGRLILKLPNAYTFFASRDIYVDFTHELSFTPQSALQVLNVVGFSPIHVLPIYAPVRGIKSALKRIAWTVVFVPVLRVWSYMSDGERQPAIYTVNQLVVGVKP